MLRIIIVVAAGSLALQLAGCGASAQSQTRGSATYAKPSNQGGQPVSPQPNTSDMQLTIAINGSGAFAPVQSAACTLTSGSISETSTSSGQVNSDGTYGSFFSTESANGTGDSALCGALKNVKLSSITTMTVQASIPSNPPNCQAYCKATASTQCQGSIDPNCVSNTTSTCSTGCSGASKITGHGSLQSSDMADANNQLTSSQGEFNAKVDLVFDAVQ